MLSHIKNLGFTKYGNGPWPRQQRFNHIQKKYELDPKNEPLKALLMGIRSDEEGSRSKERYFSVRSEDATWNIESMPAELWDEFNVDLAPNQSVRVHPLLDWTEKNIWEYIVQENIEVTSLYFDQGDQMRYRSLGCWALHKKNILNRNECTRRADRNFIWKIRRDRQTSDAIR